MKFINILLYFLIAIILIGTIGIWLPTLLQYTKGESISYFEVLQNSVTYFITIIVAGCVDIILKSIKNNYKNIQGIVLFMIFLLLIAIGLVIYSTITIINNDFKLSFYLVLSGIIIAWALWWITNWDRSDLDPKNALGGSV